MITNQIKNPAEGGRKLRGIVVSNKMKDTAVVVVKRLVKHPFYGKYVTVAKKYKVHDPGNKSAVGDKVVIMECRPISKEKHFKIAHEVK